MLLVGLGREKDFREREYRAAIRTAVKTLNETGAFDGTLYLTEVPVKKRDADWQVRQAALVAAGRGVSLRCDEKQEGRSAPPAAQARR